MKFLKVLKNFMINIDVVRVENGEVIMDWDVVRVCIIGYKGEPRIVSKESEISIPKEVARKMYSQAGAILKSRGWL